METAVEKGHICDVVCGGDIVCRCRSNPLIELEDLPFRCANICNAGAVKVNDEYVLLITIQDLQGYYAIYPARGSDGFSFTISDTPLLTPIREGQWAEYEAMGVLDARVTAIDGEYYITYDALGPHGYCLALARTDTNFEAVHRIGIVSEPDNKGGALFPRKIDGKFVLFERPWTGGSIWVNYSDDLEYWGGAEIVMTPRGDYWDAARIAAATPPIEIDQGWLFLYSGVKDTSAGPLFRIGAAILDRKNPAKVVGRTNVPILSPRLMYERVGDVPNLVFSCGAILEPGGEIKLYYGAANSCICIGTTDLETIVATCFESDREY